MNHNAHEVFNVKLQSTRDDNYRRGGYALKRGINDLENVSRSSVIAFKRDPSIALLNVEPMGMGTEENLSSELDASYSALKDAGAQPLDGAAGQLNASGGEQNAVQFLAGLIDQLTPAQFTQGGVPDAKALSALAERTVSAAERDEAFALHQAMKAAKAEQEQQ
jgi:hypothetical protein